jgi:Flp pilus assembly protein TadD
VPEALTLADEAMQAGDSARATFIFEQVLKAAPEEPRALNGLGVLAINANRLAAAEDYLRRAIAAWPSDAAFHNNLCEVYRQLGRLDEAAECCHKALALAPNSPQLHNNLAVVLKQHGEFDLALKSFQRAIELNPTAGHCYYNLANCYSELHRLDLAEAAFQRAIELEPQSYDIHNNIANVLELQGKWSQSLDHLNESLRLRPDYANSHRNRALLNLLLGNFAEGWSEYEWRWQVPGVKLPAFPRPRWQGESLEGRTILLCSEQGLGDAVQFIRYAPMVQARGAQVIVQCPGMLHRLLSTTPGIDHFAAAEGSPEMFDYFVPMLSLPGLFETRVETIPANVPYVFAEPDRIAKWGQELAAIEGFKVGIAWQGNPGFGGDYYRSVRLAELAPLAAVPNVKLFSLQKGTGAEQVAGVSWPIVDWTDRLDRDAAFVDTAAMIMNLDLVITTDTSIAHVAGALGARVWVALQYSPNWRWLLERSDCPWYPSMRLFRQPRFGDWPSVFAQVAAELQAVSSGAKPGVESQ